MEVNMRIRRTIFAPVILALGAVGALGAAPVLVIAAAATPASAAVASGTATPAVMYYHG
jgi:hypothetical protein